MAWSDEESIITDVGLQMLQSVLDGKSLRIVSAKASGGYTPPSELAGIVELVEPLDVPCRLIGNTELEGAAGRLITILVSNEGVTEPQRVKQIGIFAQLDGELPALFGIMQDEIGENVPTEAGYKDFGLEFSTAIPIASADRITVDLSPLGYATKPELAEAIAAHNSDRQAHPELVSEIRNALEEASKSSFAKHIIATRTRDPSKPTYGINDDEGGGGETEAVSAALHLGSYTGTAEVSAIVNGVEYDALNLSHDGDSSIPDGNITFST